MPNLFETAQEFHQQNKVIKTGDRHKDQLVRELLLILQTAPFLSTTEKEQMAQTIPLFNARVIRSVKESLIRQGLRHFQNLKTSHAA
jgi:hypothetical protein